MPTVYSQENIAEDSKSLSNIVILFFRYLSRLFQISISYVLDIYHVHFRYLSVAS